MGFESREGVKEALILAASVGLYFEWLEQVALHATICARISASARIGTMANLNGSATHYCRAGIRSCKSEKLQCYCVPPRARRRLPRLSALALQFSPCSSQLNCS